MTVQNIEPIIEEISRRLGDRSFYTRKELLTVGIFGSLAAVNNAIKLGGLKTLQVSPRRTVILRTELINYLRKNCQNNDSN